MGTLDDVEKLIKSHIERRPLMETVDVYKLLYQGVFGVGHILGEDAWLRLEAEARSVKLNEVPDEPLLEDVSTDGSMVRVNLRPYLKKGLPVEELYSAMIRSSPKGGREQFRALWKAFKELVNSGRLKFNIEEVKDLDEIVEFENVPPTHHSDVYRRSYFPSYRVVERRVIEEFLGNRL